MTLNEYTRLVQFLQTLLPVGTEAAANAIARDPRDMRADELLPSPPGPSEFVFMELMDRQIAQGERWLTGLDKLLAMMTPFAILGEQMAKAAQEQTTDAPLPVKRMRKPKEGNGAAATDPATVSPVPPATPEKATAPASADELPDFLKRTGQTAQAPQTPAPAPTSGGKELQLEDVRAVLTDYMNKFGEDGMEKLSVLLSEFDATQISTLKPEHWKACVNKAKRELIL